MHACTHACLCVCVRERERERDRERVCVCARACVRACVRVCVHESVRIDHIMRARTHAFQVHTLGPGASFRGDRHTCGTAGSDGIVLRRVAVCPAFLVGSAASPTCRRCGPCKGAQRQRRRRCCAVSAAAALVLAARAFAPASSSPSPRDPAPSCDNLGRARRREWRGANSLK